MMKENKYYTPTIEEFYVGFEYEYYGDRHGEDKLWHKTTCKDLSGIRHRLEDFDTSAVRIKYLDKSDIESLGFKYLSEKSLKNLTHRFEIRGVYKRILDEHDDTMWWNVYLKHYPYRNIITISGDISDGSIYEKFAELVIKNKSELKKLLAQLNII